MKKQKVRRGKQTPQKITGTISINSKAVGYVSNEKFKEDIEIPTTFLKTALNKDEVEVAILPKKALRRTFGKKSRIFGEVVNILKRAKTNFVGVIQKNDLGISYLVPDDRKMYADILIPKIAGEEIPENKKVLVKIVKWESQEKSPEGKIIKILGEKGDNGVEMESIILERGFEVGFPEEVLKDAEITKEKNAGEENFKAGISKRRDCRGDLTFTIDPQDAKDFDDAISIKKLSENEFEIGVHIADVSHYVKENTALDREARKRGFSVYLVDRTIPMLPEILSNELCSLNPKEDKLTMSAIFTVTKDGRVTKKWFGKTIINSDKRFSYEEAQESIQNPQGVFHNELSILNSIAKKFREEKFKKGAIDFEQDEVKFKLDETGKPIGVYKKTRLDAHKLVEEFMLLANREVAWFFHTQNKSTGRSFIYRIHDVPDPEKLDNLSIFLRAMGYELTPSAKGITSKDIQAVLKKIEGKSEESLIKTAAIRSMAKAAYSTKNIGHFGLAFQYYTHFTSPIRRYADLVVHRLLEKLLENRRMEQDEFVKYEKISRETSEKEIRAAEAERESIKYKQVEFMKEKVGQEFDGTITGVTDWGIYIEEKETKAEGMAKLRDLQDDFYVLDEKNYAIVGQKTGKKFSLGDSVRFRITGADVERKTLDYLLI